jgi:broad specificity phosphatase PhoE
VCCRPDRPRWTGQGSVVPLTRLGQPGPAVVLIRHAGVTSGADIDPPLNSAGTVRAQKRRHVLSDSGITAIFVTSLRRSRETARPLADDLGLQSIVEDDPAAIVDTIRARDGSTTILVIGHTNTVPDLVSQLGGPAITPIATTEFDRLLVLANHGLCSLRYGQRSE